MTRTLVVVAALTAAAVAAGAVYLLHRRIKTLEVRMSQQYTELSDALSANDQAQTKALNRVAEDVAELKRRADEGAPAEDLRPLIDQVNASTQRLQGVDPDPSFPAAEQPSDETPVEPAPALRPGDETPAA